MGTCRINALTINTANIYFSIRLGLIMTVYIVYSIHKQILGNPRTKIHDVHISRESAWKQIEWEYYENVIPHIQNILLYDITNVEIDYNGLTIEYEDFEKDIYRTSEYKIIEKEAGDWMYVKF